MKSIEKKMEASLTTANLLDSAAGISEVLIDAIMEEGILREIPILGGLSSITKSILDVREYFFARKVIRFLLEIAHIDPQEINGFIERINTDPKEKRKVGGAVLSIIDKLEEERKANLLGFFFVKLLQTKISYDTYLRYANAITLIYWTDLMTLSSFAPEDPLDSRHFTPMLICGLAHVYDAGALMVNESFPAEIRLSDMGKEFNELLKEYFLKSANSE